MIQSLTLGNKTFPINLIQGPLAGVSHSPFRLLTSLYGKPAFSCTEMISCKTLLHQPRDMHKRFVNIDPEEGPVCFQLSANNPLELAEATKIVTDYGANLIDLNCGCPVKKIRGKGAGSKLLADTKNLFALISAMKQNTSIPVSIKIRVDGKSSEKFNQEIATVVADAGADFLVVHGRHWSEGYDTACHYDQIQFFVEALNIPVIGNGDIACLASLKKMLATGCAGAMIARAGVGQPWLIQKLIAEWNQESYTLPSFKEIGALFVTHVAKMTTLFGCEKFSIQEARKISKYYARGLPLKTEFCAAINQCDTLKDFGNICQRYFT
jgi:tRNA-dihydrouridine synthase B